MGILSGKIVDASTKQQIQVRVQVLPPHGEALAPEDALWKVGTGEPFFYSDGEFSLTVPRGRVQVVVERGTEYTPWRHTIELGESDTASLDIELQRWCEPASQGWHPGNTHLHYKFKKETVDVDRRLWYDSRCEDLRMTATSYVKRWDHTYESNKYPPGKLNEFTDDNHYVQHGEETRNNMGGLRPDGLRLTTKSTSTGVELGAHHTYGYGHLMLLNLRNVVKPGSRGLLVDSYDPDYPPLSYACDDAKQQGGIAIWAHNGHGLECPVASILGKVDAINLWDTYWEDLEYDVWYRLLNCGIRLPASTGSDWYLCSANRVYTKSQPKFEYESWLQALRDGKTFITNGPILGLNVDGSEIGDTVEVKPGSSVTVNVKWESHYAVHNVEIVANGGVVHAENFPEGSTNGSFEYQMPVNADGWIAARIGSNSRDSFAQTIWAHTSPVYVNAGGIAPPERIRDSAIFVQHINDSLTWLESSARFYTDQQRKEVFDLFRQAQDLYRKLSG